MKAIYTYEIRYGQYDDARKIMVQGYASLDKELAQKAILESQVAYQEWVCKEILSESRDVKDDYFNDYQFAYILAKVLEGYGYHRINADGSFFMKYTLDSVEFEGTTK